MKYKTDLHCHTSEMSGCASENLYDTTQKYINCGYTSLVITNHFKSKNRVGELSDYKTYVDAHFDIIDKAAEAAHGKLYIIPGVELKMKDSINEYLIFGATREIFYGIPEIFDKNIKYVHDYFSSHGCLVIQSHPMRWGISLVRPEHIDGYEVLNTHVNHENHNDIAEIIAERIGGEGKIRTAGTDHHDACQIPNTGILTEEPVTSGEELVRVMKSGRYEIFHEKREP